MKEMNEVKNDSLTNSNNEDNALPSNEFEVKLEGIEIEGPTLVENKAQGIKLELLTESSSSKDLMHVDENEVGVTELIGTEAKTNLNETGKEKNKRTDSPKKKFVLRPRKLDTNQNSEEFSKAKKLRTVNKKIEKKCAINKVIENEFKCDEIALVNETDKSLNITTDSNAATTEIGVGDIPINADGIPQVKTEPFDGTQNSVSSSENDGGSSENMSVSKSLDNNSVKSKDNSESDTRISSASEYSVNKIAKRKKRRRDWSTKKKKKNDGSQVKGGDCNSVVGHEANFGWTLSANASLSINGSIDNTRKCSETSDSSQKRNQFALPSQTVTDTDLKSVAPRIAAVPPVLEKSKPLSCLCAKKPHVFISGNNNTGDLFCQALDCIDKKIVGCCNPIPSQDVALFRPSAKVSYQMMCKVHQQRLFRHNCCSACGLFCTQGRYMMCKSYHHYHRICGIENDSHAIVCPHCGDKTPPKTIVISIHSAKDPVFLPSQKSLGKEKSAKISISRGNLHDIEEKEEDPAFQFPASLFNVGDEISPSNGFTANLHRDKLAHLLNIACRSFSKLCCSNSRYTYRTLFNTSHSGDAEKLLKIIASGLNPNYVFEEHKQQTALHIAAASGHLSLVHILLQAKAEINAMDAEQNTPLTAAISAKHNDVVKYLVKCGADLLLKGEDGMTPLHIASKCGNVGACFHLLNGSHLPPRYIDSLDDGGWTPMVWASEFNHIEVVKFLISKGADPLIKDAEQNIALHWAAFGGSVDIVELYLNDGSDINAVNVHGDTPLHIAARQDKYSCVLLLLARGAKSDVKNKSGELPRDCSESPESDIYKGITLNMEISSLLTRFRDRTPRIISNDISRGKERNQIQCVNAVDNEDEPRDYIYVSESCFTSKIIIDRTINSLQSCICQNNCGTEKCNCATISIKCWYDNEGKLKPDFNYTDPPMIFECNQACLCNRITCHNRVVQNGISCRFQLFRTEGKGWGIKTLNLIPKGTYVCEYIGEIISDCEADHREDDSYLFDLDNRDGETYCIDARHYGNFARFINHMCVPNLMPVHVFIDHQDLRFPRIAFFAKKDILAGEELGYNYGEKFWVIKWKSFTCTCGSEKCMYSESTIKTTLENYKKKLSDENS